MGIALAGSAQPAPVTRPLETESLPLDGGNAKLSGPRPVLTQWPGRPPSSPIKKVCDAPSGIRPMALGGYCGVGLKTPCVLADDGYPSIALRPVPKSFGGA